MKVVLAIVAVVVLLIGGIAAMIARDIYVVRTEIDASALAALPQRDIMPMIVGSAAKPDLVVFMDGDAGWFELDLEALPPATQIGMHGPRLFDALTGNTHLPLYCSGSTTRSGKIIWVVQDAEIVRDFAFCSPRRMDLSPLREYASAVTMVDEVLTQEEIVALRPRIADAALILPSEFRPFTHERVIHVPYHWDVFDTGVSPAPQRETLLRAVEAHLGPLAQEAVVAVEERNISFLTDTMGFGDRAPTHTTGAAIVRNGTTVILPDTVISRFHITVTCTPAACEALDGFDAAPLLAPFRDETILDDRLAVALRIERNPDDLMPSAAALRDGATRLAPTARVTYAVRYIERP